MSQFPDPYERLASDSTFTALERLEQYAAAHGRSMAGLALGWLLADDRIAQIVVGPSRPEHLAPVAEALAEPLTAEQRDEISAIFPALGD
jgi:aryl-alcohol dehydrogenase-like predicted oxidoreductase